MRTTPPMPLPVKRALAKLGADIKAARLRCRITTTLMAERAFINPTPVDVKARVLSLAIDESDDTASVDVALGMARECGLKQPSAREIVGEVQAAVAQWRACAATHGLNARDLTRMASAFEHGETVGA